jgi:hypothetical protein
MTHKRKKKIGMTSTIRLFAILLVPVLALILGISAPQVWANDEPVCWFNIEFNATDLDVGVRGFFDYEPWEELQIENPKGKELAEVEAEKRLSKQGFAELFFESGEPELSELPFKKFFRRFPEGFYEFEAETIEDDEVDCEEYFSHVIPCEPDIEASGDSVNGVIISWAPVTQVVDTAATDANVKHEIEEPLVCNNSAALNIVSYEVIVETEVAGEEKEYKIDLPGTATEVSVPLEFIGLSDEFDYEVLAIEESGNQTISEDEFCVNGGNVEECP